MCTLVVIRDPRTPLLVGATRDERPDRPTSAPSYITPEVFAPKDEVFGGTWLGVNTHGILVAITNSDAADALHTVGGPRASLMQDCLHAYSVSDALEHAWTSSDASVRGYHMIIADTHQAFLVWHHGRDKGFKTLPDGISIITTMGIEPDHCARERGIRKRLAKTPHITPKSLLKSMKFHSVVDPENGACVHGKGITMESISHITAQANQNEWSISWKSGRPCESNPIIHQCVPYHISENNT